MSGSRVRRENGRPVKFRSEGYGDDIQRIVRLKKAIEIDPSPEMAPFKQMLFAMLDGMVAVFSLYGTASPQAWALAKTFMDKMQNAYDAADRSGS